MFIIYVIDLSTKIKCKDGRSHFYKNQKYKPLKVENFFLSYFISEIPNCSICVFSENAQRFVEVFL